jgi:phytoene/squalene synthetase
MTSQHTSSPEVEAVRRKAEGSSFYSAMRLMPRSGREAMYAIYAFCRIVDDIADDGEGTRVERLAALDEWRDDLRSLYDRGRGGRAAFLREVVESYKPRLEDFLAVVDGMQMDVDGDIVAPTLEQLDLYCDRVASAVGRLSIKVFGMEEGPGFALSRMQPLGGCICRASISMRAWGRSIPKPCWPIRPSTGPAGRSLCWRARTMTRPVRSWPSGPGAICARPS